MSRLVDKAANKKSVTELLDYYNADAGQHLFKTLPSASISTSTSMSTSNNTCYKLFIYTTKKRGDQINLFYKHIINKLLPFSACCFPR